MFHSGRDFSLNYSLFKKSFQNPLEFSFLGEGEIEELIHLDSNPPLEESMSFFGLSLNKLEQTKIMQKINRKAEWNVRQSIESELSSFLGLQLQDIYYFSEDNDWNSFIARIKAKEQALIIKPQVKLHLQNFHFPILLSPDAILYDKQNFALILFSSSRNPGKSIAGEFIFYEFFFRTYLGIEFFEFALIPKTVSSLQFSLSHLKNPGKSKDSILICNLFRKKITSFDNSIFSNCFSKGEYESKTYELKDNFEMTCKFMNEAKKLRDQILFRLKELDDLSFRIQSHIPKDSSYIDWFKYVKWTQIINLQSLKKNYQDSQISNIFSVTGNPFKKALSLLFPNFPIINSSLLDIKKAFQLASIAEKHKYLENISPSSFSNFLSSSFSANKKFRELNSVFSVEGQQLLKERILSIKWQIYYDFESYENLLTQLSLQIFKENKLFCNKNLIKDPEIDENEIEKKFIESLAEPIILELSSELDNFSEEGAIEQLKSKIVYISFNKAFECAWLKKLKEKRLTVNNLLLAKLCEIIKELTIDLSDWFKFSKNSSLNIIGELLGSHTLKKLANIVTHQQGKKYSQLEWAQNGREASLMYFYFHSEIFNSNNEKDLPNEDLSPLHWIKGYKERKIKEWNAAKAFLQEYCALDVQNMIDGVKWLQKNYEINKDKLVKQSEILEWIAWFKDLSARQLSELIEKFLQHKREN